MRKLLSIALMATLIVSMTPMMGVNKSTSSRGLVYADTILIDEEHFPDAGFRNYLIEKYGSSFDPTSITILDVSERSLTSLEGIEYFTALIILYCDKNNLSSLDISNNTALKELYCNNNNLSNLDISNNTALKSLRCQYNNLSSLDISNNTALEELACGGNNLSSLDISNNTVLRHLDCAKNNLSSLDISNNTALKRLNCQFSNLSSLDISNNTALESLACGYNNLSSLDISNNTALESLACGGNNLRSLDISNNTALEELGCGGNNLSSLDISNNTVLRHLDCANNNLNSLDISNNTALRSLDCSNNDLGKLYVRTKLPETCIYDDGVEIIYGEGPDESFYSYGIGDFVIGRDSNNFCNVGTSASNNYNDCGYKDEKFCDVLDYKYYAKLIALEGLDANVKNCFIKQSRITLAYYTIKIGGICYGTAATMAMLKSGAMDIGDLTDEDATSYYNLGAPVNDPKFGQMIYYYVLSQYSSILELSTISSTNKDGVSGFSKTLVSLLQNSDKPYQINRKGHSWIATEVETNSDGSYTVEMFDENTVYRSKNEEDPWYSKNGYFTHMSISSDFESLSFTDVTKGYEYYTNDNDQVYYINKEGKTCEENIWISDPDKENPEKMPSLKKENLEENILDKWNAISFWNNDSISLTNSEGETMSYSASEDHISGDMRVEDIRTINFGENDFKYIVYVPKSNFYKVNAQNSDLDITLFSEENIIAIKGTDINNITLDSNLNAVVEGESDGYTFDIASTVRNNNNEVGLDLINISGEASDDLKVTNSTESFGIQSDSIVHRANVVIHSDNQETESNLNNATTINVKADNNITSDAQNEPESNERIYGQGRYDTAIEAAEKYKDSADSKFENVIVAYGRNFPDALAGGYLAKVKNAPILLVEPSQEDRIADYISKNIASGGKVYLLGGTGVVSSAFEKKVKDKGIKTERLGGQTRFDTNMAILDASGVTDEDILVCTGTGYADSLSASAVGKPILLVGDTLTDAQKSYLKSLSSDQFYLIGGTGAVKPAIEENLKGLGYSKIDRLAGSTRYETSTAVATEFFPKAKTVILAYAQNFPDGLSGGPLAMKKNAPIILTDSSKTEAAAKYVKESGAISSITLGGPALISDIAVKAIMGR